MVENKQCHAPSIISIWKFSPVFEVIVWVCDQHGPVLEVGGDDEWLSAPVHHGLGLRLSACVGGVAQVRIKPLPVLGSGLNLLSKLYTRKKDDLWASFYASHLFKGRSLLLYLTTYRPCLRSGEVCVDVHPVVVGGAADPAGAGALALRGPVPAVRV